MRAVIQRVSNASVTINGIRKSAIGHGMLVLLGIEESDGAGDIEWLARKVVGLRLFDDKDGVMNLDIRAVDGEMLLVSQFTLYASTRKGNRPSYIRAARPEIAIPIYEKLIAVLSFELGKHIATGEFGADMQVGLVNDGPVTIVIDSKAKE